MTTPESVANEMSKPGTFNLVERVLGRNMPTDTVDIYFDEAAGYRYQKLRQLHGSALSNEVEAIEAEMDEVKARLAESTYIFHLRGISNDEHDKLIDEATESFPLEYEELVHPLTGQKQKLLIENLDRDTLINSLMLAAMIEKVEDPDGNIDDDITVEKVSIIKGNFPLDGIRRLSQTVNDLRMAVAWMDEIQNEDFSPRP